jgi:hypothetical protein
MRDGAAPGPPPANGRCRASVVRIGLSALACCVVGCGGDGGGSVPTVDAAVDAAIDAAGPPWWQPKVGDAKNWDIQLTTQVAQIDVSAPRVMYDLDLWALVPAPTMIDYGDGDPVAVPAGALAGTLAELHARTPKPVVICHVETGALELGRPDARKFAGYEPDPTKIPDNPATAPVGTVKGAPAPGSVIGWSAETPDLRLLDIREASRSRWTSIMFKRFDLAKQIGCDGVEPSHNNVVNYPSGFSPAVGILDSYSWYGEVAAQGHARMLSTGMKDGDGVPNQIDMMADKFDWLMVERCGELEYCDASRPFIDLDKAVLAIDYNVNDTGGAQTSGVVCQNQALAMIADGIFKDVALTKNVRTQCVP